MIKTDDLKKELTQSLAAPVELLNAQMGRLALKGKVFKAFLPAEHIQIDELWHKCQEIDDGIQVILDIFSFPARGRCGKKK